MSRIRWIALTLLAVSATLITHWLVLAMTGIALGPVQSLGALGLVGALNLGIMTLLWRRRRGRVGFVVTRVWMVASISALFAGPLMLAAFGLSAIGAGLGHATGMLEPFPWSGAWLAGGGLGLAAAFGAMFWGFLVGQRKVHVERLDLRLPGLPPALSGLRIAHITDLHIGPQLRAPLLRELVEQVNALEPDLSAITGDIFDFDPAFVEEGCKELAALQARHGCYAVLGNHDCAVGADDVEQIEQAEEPQPEL